MTATGFWLLDHPNPNGPFYHPTRLTCQHGISPDRLPHLIVVHTAEALPDYTGEDTSGDALARYASTTARKVSWHATIDADSTIPMLPDSYTGAHVIGYNRCAVGLEIGTKASLWATLAQSAPDWYRQIMATAANQVAWWCTTHKISPTFLTNTAIDKGARGVTSHAMLDPLRRSDPGADFAWARFIADVAGRLASPSGYLDRGEWPTWASASIQKTIDRKVMVADGKLWHPSDTLTRAELAVILDRLTLLG